MLRNALRFTVGAALGLFLWWYGTPAYGELIARTARPLLALKFSGARLAMAGRQMEIFGSLPGGHIPFDQLTYNIVLFVGLFATVRGVWKDRNAIRFVAALTLLIVTHILATTVNFIAT